MAEQEHISRRERSNSPRPTIGGYTIVPFSRSTPMILIQTFDNRIPSAQKNDLNATDPPIPPLTEEQEMIVAIRKPVDTGSLQAMMRAELFLLAGGIGDDMFAKFKHNQVAGIEITFSQQSPLGLEVFDSAGFKATHKAIRSEFDAALKKQARAGKVDVNALEANQFGSGRFGRPIKFNSNGIKTTVDFAIPRTEVTLQAVIGGSFQGGHVALKAFYPDRNKNTYLAVLEYVLLDHFGVDNSDVQLPLPHGSPGQVAFWVLQHQRHPGHNPYVTKVVIEIAIEGNLS